MGQANKERSNINIVDQETDFLQSHFDVLPSSAIPHGPLEGLSSCTWWCLQE